MKRLDSFVGRCSSPNDSERFVYQRVDQCAAQVEEHAASVNYLFEHTPGRAESLVRALYATPVTPLSTKS